MTPVVGGIEMTGPSVDSADASCSPVPWKPASEDPMESVKTAFGKCLIQRSFTDFEKMAALDAIANNVCPS